MDEACANKQDEVYAGRFALVKYDAEEALDKKLHGLASTYTDPSKDNITYYLSLIYEKLAKEFLANQEPGKVRAKHMK